VRCANLRLRTNRLEALPRWFRPHPAEICDSFVHKMMAKIENRDYPNEPMCGPNLWRRKSGDRLAWVGEDRPERRSRNGILAILDCQYAVLAVGKEDRGGLARGIHRLRSAYRTGHETGRCCALPGCSEGCKGIGDSAYVGA
jgi:hypothetical protein